MSNFINTGNYSINTDHIIYIEENLYGNIAIHLTSGETIYADELSFEELYGYSRVRQLIPCNYPVIEKSHDGTPAVVNARFLAVTADGSVRSVGDVRTPIDLRDPEIFNSKAGYSDAALK